VNYEFSRHTARHAACYRGIIDSHSSEGILRRNYRKSISMRTHTRAATRDRYSLIYEVAAAPKNNPISRYRIRLVIVYPITSGKNYFLRHTRSSRVTPIWRISEQSHTRSLFVCRSSAREGNIKENNEARARAVLHDESCGQPNGVWLARRPFQVSLMQRRDDFKDRVENLIGNDNGGKIHLTSTSDLTLSVPSRSAHARARGSRGMDLATASFSFLPSLHFDQATCPIPSPLASSPSRSRDGVVEMKKNRPPKFDAA